MKNELLIISFLICFPFLACERLEPIPPINSNGKHIEFFGFTLIDTYWDDPTDSEEKTNYADEVHTFCNVADILVVTPSDNLKDRIKAFKSLEMKTLLHLSELFYEVVGTNSESGTEYDLRDDYKERWDEFSIMHAEVLTAEFISSFYIGEEPTWNGISFMELNAVSELLKEKKPTIPIMIIEAYPVIDDLQVPETVDYVGFDHYFIKDPTTDSVFQQELALIKTKLSTSNQRIVLIMDTHYISWAHGDFGNINITEMGEVANDYYNLAKSDTSVVGILAYFWPNGFDFEESTGARGMPDDIKLEYRKIGQEITGK